MSCGFRKLLVNLQTLDLSNNQLSSLPEGIRNLGNSRE
ncbi:leucine-rich repeat domain-containing protein [Richelia sinica]